MTVYEKISMVKLAMKITAKGTVNLIVGNRDGGKSFTLISMMQPIVEKWYPGMPNVEFMTNVVFSEGGVKGRSMPDGVSYVDSVECLLRTIAELLQKHRGKDVRLVYAMDEAQAHMLSDQNSDPVNQSMLHILAVIRKFRMSVWYLSPLRENLVPKVRFFMEDPVKQGNLNYLWRKDFRMAKRFIAAHDLKTSPKQYISVQFSPSLPPLLLYVPYVPWCKKIKDLKPGEFGYDDESAATTTYGYTKGFDHQKALDSISGLTHEEIGDALQDYFDRLDRGITEEGQEDQETKDLRAQAERVSRARMQKVAWDTIEYMEQTHRNTLRSRMNKFSVSTERGSTSTNDDNGVAGEGT